LGGLQQPKQRTKPFAAARWEDQEEQLEDSELGPGQLRMDS